MISLTLHAFASSAVAAQSPGGLAGPNCLPRLCCCAAQDEAVYRGHAISVLQAVGLTEPHMSLIRSLTPAQAAQLYEAAGSYDQAASLRPGSGGHSPTKKLMSASLRSL